MNWAGFQQQRAAGCPVWEEAMNCPVPLTVMSGWHWHRWCTPDLQLVRGAQSIPAWTHVRKASASRDRRHVRRQSERLAEGETAERTCGWRCALGRTGSMPTGYVPQGLQLWAIHIRARTTLRDCSCGPLTAGPPTPGQGQPWGTISNPHWGRDTEKQRRAEENQQEARRSSRKKPLGIRPSCSARHLAKGAGDGLSVTCSENQGSRDGWVGIFGLSWK